MTRVAERTQRRLTLTQLSEQTGVSQVTICKYMKNPELRKRIPHVGEGRKRRYVAGAAKALKQIRKENLKRRSRRGKSRVASQPPVVSGPSLEVPALLMQGRAGELMGKLRSLRQQEDAVLEELTVELKKPIALTVTAS